MTQQETSESTSSNGALEQVRDLLFGAQIRSLQSRMDQMEADFRRELQQTREESAKSVQELDQFVRQEFDSLGVRLDEESQARHVQVQDLEKAMKAMGKELTDRIQDLGKRLSKDMREGMDKMEKSTRKGLDRLQEDKANRSDLANLFNGVAQRLTGALQAPVEEKAK
ncbi:MAG: hypothetical protein DWQ01_11575 [Planctomycetota bacterium]|nr:MAG: hypothetical protein DWQ01_11575 [Planctomycetota bacterium]